MTLAAGSRRRGATLGTTLALRRRLPAARIWPGTRGRANAIIPPELGISQGEIPCSGGNQVAVRYRRAGSLELHVEILEIIPVTVSRKVLRAYVSVIFVLKAHAFALERILVPHEHLLRLT
jgi:hypothetical protein